MSYSISLELKVDMQVYFSLSACMPLHRNPVGEHGCRFKSDRFAEEIQKWVSFLRAEKEKIWVEGAVAVE